MKVVQVHFWGNAADLTGSVEKVIDGFARLDAPGIELVIASRAGQATAIVRHGKRFLTFAESRWRNRIFNKILGLGRMSFPALIKLLQRERPDIIHFHNRPELVDRVIGGLGWRPRVICQYHRRFPHFEIPASADMLITVSAAIRQALLAASATSKPVRVVYNPVPAGISASPPALLDARPLKLLYAGGAQAHKGFEEILSAVSRFAQRDDLEFLFCGPKFEAYVSPQENVRVLGALPYEEFQRCLATSHILLMPSHFEGFSLVVLEALARGKLLVATRCGGLGEIVADDCALVVPPADPQQLALGIAQAIDLFAPSRREELNALLAMAARKLQLFSVDAVNHELAACYVELMENQRNP